MEAGGGRGAVGVVGSCVSDCCMCVGFDDVGMSRDEEDTGKLAVRRELGGRESVLGMGLQAFSSSGLSCVRTLLRR